MRKKHMIRILLAVLMLLVGCNSEGGIKSSSGNSTGPSATLGSGGTVLRIVSGSENRELESLIQGYADKNKMTIEMTYMGSIDIMRKLQEQTTDFDAVWPASSIWISMGDTSFRVKHTESSTITPVVFGIRKPLAEELGFVGRDVSINDIMQAIEEGKLKFCMTSATQSNSGASAYLGFLSGLAGSPEVLTQEILRDPQLQQRITQLLAGVERSSGSSEWLKTMFLAGDYDAMVNYESLMITTNEELIRRGEEPLYVVYPYDGLSISDSPLGYIDQGEQKKEEAFLDFQAYLASEEAQDAMQKLGRRTGYTGVYERNEGVFNPDWGVDTKRVLSPIKVPASEVLSEALNLYQTNFRKPSLSVYCLDFSGSMSGEGEKQVKEAMDLLLDQKKAASVLLQAGQNEVNQIYFFDDGILGGVTGTDGSEATLTALNEAVQNQRIGGGTNMYNAIVLGLEFLKGYDLTQYTPAIILLTDGMSIDDYEMFKAEYDALGVEIPIFSIMFGSADESQLKELAELTNARVFDGREDLINAFRSVKGYN
ncbi:MAG: VWA domain-containing protein [Tissierellia bacterium]|nr:VWA domain-containing protein [Tissierellia bacterium]